MLNKEEYLKLVDVAAQQGKIIELINGEPTIVEPPKFAEPVYIPPLEETTPLTFVQVKERTLSRARQEVSQVIYSKYPTYKQDNLAIYGTETEKQAFKEFKEARVAIYDELVQQINNCNTVKELEAIDITRAFVTSPNNPQEFNHA